ncbi:MAG TPA: Crp/Fnr family transcriptional regulator [Pyrinomonadaceae bacterium]|nr:Crp/Fnr family transcriptional regulator [Pyrinomonadaceae bacterium]
MDAYINHKSNLILNALPTQEYERLYTHLEYVELPLGKILYDPEEPIRHAYFPLRGAVSVVTVLRDGGSVEAGVIGKEGVVGIPLVLGRETELNRRAVVQIQGSGLRLKATALTEEFRRGERLHDLLLSYLHAFITQISQTAACNRMHRLEERLARWLLACQDRLGSDEMQLTQEFIAEMLGVRRAGVSVAATQLQERGLIKHKRGFIQIIDREGLEAASCECYGVVRREYQRLFENRAATG